jgi:hypothetical protein
MSPSIRSNCGTPWTSRAYGRMTGEGLDGRVRRNTAEGGGSVEASIEAWPYLDEAALLRTRSCKVYMTG